MSFDLMVFDNKKAPRMREAFLAWYRQQTAWSEEHDYDHPDVTSDNLRNWFLEIIETFPAMNGVFAPDDDDFDWDKENYLTDYSIGSEVIYAAFAWSLAEEAEKLVQQLAEKHRVGFFAASTDGKIDYND